MDSEALEIMKIKSAFNAESLSTQMQQVQQHKMTVKTSYVFINAKKQFLKSLYMEPCDWLTTEEADKELDDASTELQGIKTEIKEVKDTMLSLCESAEEGYTLLTQKQDLLEEKMKELEEKKCELDRRRTRCTSSGVRCDNSDTQGNTGQEMVDNLTEKIAAVESAILKCNEAIASVRRELQDIDPVIRNLEHTLAQNSHSLEKTKTEKEKRKTVMSQLSQQLDKLVHDVEELAGVTVVPLSWSALRVEFPASSSDNAGVQLALSLEFTENNLGGLILKSAQVNVESIDASELLREAVAHNDVPVLVTKLKSRWLSHQPLLSEISQLRLRSAVDWIQEESLLRVMVGRGGCIVCTLNVPPSYPLSGEVTLADIKGHAVTDDISELQPSGYERTLTTWVDCLEAKFGRP